MAAKTILKFTSKQRPGYFLGRARKRGAIWGLWIDNRRKGADDVQHGGEGDWNDCELPHSRVGTKEEVGKPNEE